MQKIRLDIPFIDMAIQVHDQFDLETLELFSMLAWRFWHRRNKWIPDQIYSDPKMFMSHTLSLLKCYQELIYLSSTLLRPQGHWTWPPDDYLKLNVGETLFFDRNKARMGMILHMVIPDLQQAFLRRASMI